MKSLFIVNPSSGMQYVQNSTHSLVKMLLKNKIVQENHTFYTQKGGDAYERAKAVKKGEYGVIVAVGGDGTVNEVMNGIIDGGSETPMTILGAGTTNDFATILGIGKSAQSLYKVIRDYDVRDVDVGMMNGHYFLNVASGGMLSDIAHNVSTESKTALGRLAYYGEGAKELASLNLRTSMIHYEWDDGEFDEDTFLLVVCNSCQSGGFNKIAPQAKLNDGLLDVCIVKKIAIPEVVPVFAEIMAGRHPKSSKVRYFQTKHLKAVRVNKEDKFTLDYDGEIAGEMPMEAVAVPGKLKMLVAKSRKVDKLFE